MFIHPTHAGRSILVGDSDDDGEPNTYDYNDSFIDDQGEPIISKSLHNIHNERCLV